MWWILSQRPGRCLRHSGMGVEVSASHMAPPHPASMAPAMSERALSPIMIQCAGSVWAVCSAWRKNSESGLLHPTSSLSIIGENNPFRPPDWSLRYCTSRNPLLTIPVRSPRVWMAAIAWVAPSISPGSRQAVAGIRHQARATVFRLPCGSCPHISEVGRNACRRVLRSISLLSYFSQSFLFML